jgi:hypothetical protein
MGIQCDCSIVFDAGETIRCSSKAIRKARKQHQCVECLEDIEPGQRYEHVRGLDVDGDPFSDRTCLPCAAIRDQYCPSGYHVGHVAEQIEPCIGWDYREHPPGGPDDPQYDGSVAERKPIGRYDDG